MKIDKKSPIRVSLHIHTGPKRKAEEKVHDSRNEMSFQEQALTNLYLLPKGEI